MNGSDGIIVNFYNDGMLELAENQLVSFEKTGITRYVSYTTGKASYDYLKEKGYNVELYDVDKAQEEMNWGSEDFIDMEKLRVRLLKDLLEKHSCVFYLDVDIVVLNNIEFLFRVAARGASELYMQNDVNMPCMGCMLLFNTDSVVKMLDSLAEVRGDVLQPCLPGCIGQHRVKFEMLPLELFPNGLVFFGKEGVIDSPVNNRLLGETETVRSRTRENFKNNRVFLVHANYMTGLENKRTAFRNFGLWYLD